MSVTVRALNADEARWLTAARLVAIEHAPYLAHALFATRSVAAESLGTFAVDRHWRLYLDPSPLAAWGPQLAGGVLVHEVGHLVRAHAERADALGVDLDHERWNVAADAALNDDLIEAGVPLPEGVVTPGGLGLAAGASRRRTTPLSPRGSGQPCRTQPAAGRAPATRRPAGSCRAMTRPHLASDQPMPA